MLRFLSERPIRLPQWNASRTRPGDPAIFGFNDERDDIVATVARRVAELEGSNPQHLELILNDAAYHEIRRLESQGDKEAKESLPFWRSFIRRIAKMSEHEKRRALDAMLEHMARDVAGNFDRRVYDFARGAAPRLLTGLMQPSSLPSELFGKGPSTIERLLNVEGPIDKLRRLEDVGTLVYVPTHSSNMDSIVLATALDRVGLSPVVYGAGKNLFTNPIISFFMHNLGAYRVDRRIRVRAYKSVLKTYAQVMVERNYHSLFFPGGTRSRSGMIEHRLKLGLLGAAVQAFSRNQARGIGRPVYFVPATINYALVLEAETLIEDWLKERGQARYIIEDDEFSRIDRWAAFFRKIMGLSSACIIRFGDPIDPFGNPIDDEGRSIAPSGNVIDPRSYTLRDGKAVEDHARDAAYTQELGEILVTRYREETVLMATQIVAHVLYRHLVEKSSSRDVYARVRMRGEVSMPLSTLHAEVNAVRDALLSAMHRGEVRVSTFVRAETPERIVARALEIWSGYHERTAAHVERGSVVIDDPLLLLYYQNRLMPFAEILGSDASRRAAAEIYALESSR